MNANNLHLLSATGVRCCTRLMFALLLGACTVPGMQMNEKSRDNAYPGGGSSADLRERADVHAINAANVTRFAAEQRALDEEARERARKLLPGGGAAATEPYRYRVGPQDVLRILVYDHPELSNPAGTAVQSSGRVVRSDGTVYFPIAGRVRAAGRTVDEIRDDIAKGLAPQIRNPQVDVSVLEYRSQRVTVAGAVRSPGVVSITDVVSTVLDAIAAAGGPIPASGATTTAAAAAPAVPTTLVRSQTPGTAALIASSRTQAADAQTAAAAAIRGQPGIVPLPATTPLTALTPAEQAAARAAAAADLSEVTLTRDGKTFRLDLYGVFYQGRMEFDIPLRHGDVLNVGEQRYNKVFVLGEVNEPRSRVMPRGRMTLTEAVADAGGVNPFSAHAGHIFVIRGHTALGGSGRPQVFHLNASSPDAFVLADRFDLRPRDVVFVDAAPVVRWARVVNLLLPTADFVRLLLGDVTRALPR